MSKEKNLEIKVGAFVTFGLLSLTIFLFFISDFSFFEKGKSMSVVFGFANGVKNAAPVRLAGVDSGRVKDIAVFYDENEKELKVRLQLWLQENVEIPSDSNVYINQLGLLGEKYIEIIPGQSQEMLVENSTMRGEDPVPMTKITRTISHLATKVSTTVDEINEGILTRENKKSFQDTLLGLSRLVKNMNEGHGTVGKLLTDDRIFNNLEEMSSDLKENPWKLLYRPKTKKR